MTDNKLNIALIGYGKMGRTVEEIAKERGHSICAIIGSGVTINQNTVQKADAVSYTHLTLPTICSV